MWSRPFSGAVPDFGEFVARAFRRQGSTTTPHRNRFAALRPGPIVRERIGPSMSSRLRDSLDICSAAAASSVELEVDCCTSSRIFSIARTTACAPDACSSTDGIDLLRDFGEAVVALAICDEPLDCSFVAAPISCENL